MLVSALVFGGIPKKAVRKAFAEAEIFISPALLEEYREVPLALEASGKIDHLQLKTLISGIAAFVAQSKIVQLRKKFTLTRDPEDNMLLECCFEAKDEFLVTGDKDLLEIKTLPFELKIVTPRDYSETS